MKQIFTIKKTFSIRQIIRAMWAVYLREWKVLVGGAVIYVVISFLLRDEEKSGSLAVIAFLIHLVMLYLYFGVIRIMLRMIRGESYTWDHLKMNAKTILYIFGACILYVIPFFVVVALLFAIIGPSFLAMGGPIGLGIGVIVAAVVFTILCLIYSVRFGMYYFFIMDRGMKPIPALKASMKSTKGSTLRLVLFMVVSFIAMVLGALFMGLGLLIVLPMFLLCECAIYEKLAKHMYGESSEFPIVQPAELKGATPAGVEVVSAPEKTAL